MSKSLKSNCKPWVTEKVAINLSLTNNDGWKRTPHFLPLSRPNVFGGSHLACCDLCWQGRPRQQLGTHSPAGVPGVRFSSTNWAIVTPLSEAGCRPGEEDGLCRTIDLVL